MWQLSKISNEDRLVMEELERQRRKQKKKNSGDVRGKTANERSAQHGGIHQGQENRSQSQRRSPQSQRNSSHNPQRQYNRENDISENSREEERKNKELKKLRKKEAKQERKEFKKQNHELMRSTVFFAVIFFAMVGYYAYVVAVERESIVNNSYNKRLATYEETVVRGGIYTSDGKAIAKTSTDKNGNESRVYPYNGLFAHVVGMNTKSHGKTGIEKLCDYYLLSTNTNPVNKVVNEFKEQKNPGNNVVTTLNYKLQKTADKTLGKNKGAVVVLDNDSGKVLAMVSKPDYDPNKLDSIWDTLDGDKNNDSFLLNRATQGLYTPGSIFKIFTALEYMRENNNFNNFAYQCYGRATFANYTINCYDSTAHGSEDLTDAFANSCNGAFATIGTKLDNEKYVKNMNKLLFNRSLPISIEYEKSQFSLSKDSSTFDVTQTAIGQGTTLVTPIHMAMVVQAIANNGEMMVPYVVSEIDGYNGDVLKSYSPQIYDSIMTESEAKSLQTLMQAVTDHGTGRILAGADYKSGGKTGTAQIDSKNNVNSWFVGYAKKGKKNISIAVVIENVPDGSIKAVQCAKDIFDSYF